MKKTILILSLLFFSIFIVCVSCEGDITSPGRDVTIKISDHILAGYFVTAISFDSKETAWIGTFKQGLIKYDGRATIYNSSTSGFPDSTVIRDIEIDNNDNVWIATDVGLIKYDRKDFYLYNTSNSPIPEDIVWAIAVDQDNVLWFASCRFRQGGLVRFDGENWMLYTPENSVMPSNSVWDVAVDSGNNIWLIMSEIVGNGCIIKISGNDWKIYDKNDMGFAPYYFGDLTVDKDNKIYASIDYMLSSQYNMTRPNIIGYDGSKWEINNPVDEKGESLGYVGKITTDLYENIWASLHGRENVSLAVYNGQKWVYSNLNIPINSGSEIAVDKSNRVWIGTGNGIYLIKQ